MSQQINDAGPAGLRSSGDLHTDGTPDSEITPVAPDEDYIRRRGRVANPDDPPTQRPPRDARGPRPGPDFRGAPGRVAIVQGQVYLVGFILIAQLFLITTALFELLSGRTDLLWWISGASLFGFLIAVLISVWPRSRVKGF